MRRSYLDWSLAEFSSLMLIRAPFSDQTTRKQGRNIWKTSVKTREKPNGVHGVHRNMTIFATMCCMLSQKVGGKLADTAAFGENKSMLKNVIKQKDT